MPSFFSTFTPKLLKLWTGTARLIRIIGSVALVIIALTAMKSCLFPPAPVITQVTPVVRTVEVPVEKLTTKTVTKYITNKADRALVEALMKENDALRVRVQDLTLSYGAATFKGQGPVTHVETPATPTTPAVQTTTFEDWRLKFRATGNDATYTLSQSFAVVNTLGRNKDNTPVSLVSLYEIGPGATRTPIPITQSTLIASSGPQAHFYTNLNLQGGITRLGTGTTHVAVVAQWLKRGRTIAPHDTRWAFLSPAVTLTKGERSIGILPVSLNLGTLPGLRKAITNVWLSPYIGTSNGLQSNRQGLTVSVTF